MIVVRTAAIWALAQAAMAAELVITGLSEFAVPADLLRVQLQLVPTLGEAPPGGAGILAVEVLQDGRQLAFERVELVNVGQMAAGATVFPPLPTDLGRMALTVRARLSGTNLPAPLTTTAACTTWGSLVDQLDRLGTRTTSRADAPPLPSLWLEQALLANQERPSLRAARGIRSRLELLEAWLEHGELPQAEPGKSHEGAFRCASDGSVQPYRLHLPATPATGLVLVLGDPPQQAVTKSAWPELPATQRVLAANSGLAVLEWYPAGDRHWRGMALHRLAVQLDALRQEHGLTSQPVLGLGHGAGAAGVLRLAQRRPGLFRAVLLIDAYAGAPPPAPRLLEAQAQADLETCWQALPDAQLLAGAAVACHGTLPNAWSSLATEWLALEADQDLATGWRWLTNQARMEVASPALPAPASCGTHTYAYGPFTVVIGTGEHEAATTANRVLAQAFLDAWLAHAHGAPTWVRDTEVKPEVLAGRHLVLIGSPRSNAVLAGLVHKGLALPARWDHRILQGDPPLPAEVPRAADWGLVLAMPHPQDRTRLIVILDGNPTWRSAHDLPLFGLPELAFLPGPAERTLTARGARTGKAER